MSIDYIQSCNDIWSPTYKVLLTRTYECVRTCIQVIEKAKVTAANIAQENLTSIEALFIAEKAMEILDDPFGHVNRVQEVDDTISSLECQMLGIMLDRSGCSLLNEGNLQDYFFV
uniref:Uncharacterized protein n=1 Tax=Trichuris muris TaxID=70415 RepID=A0A5S6QJC5_TRIMR